MKTPLLKLTSVCFILLAAVAASRGASVGLKANDGSGTSSFNAAGQWSNSVAPSSANDYFTSGWQMRTPGDTINCTFAGASLTFQAPTLAGSGNGSFLEKSSAGGGVGRTLTINNLTNAAGGFPRSGGGNGCLIHIAGNHYAIAGNSAIWADQTSWIIDAPLLGADGVILTNRITPNQTSGYTNHVAYSGNNSGFTGIWLITGGYVEVLSANSLPGNPSVSTPGQITLGSGANLVDTAGSTFNNANGGITLAANATISTAATTIIAEPITETNSFTLTKSGAGTLRLSGANTYSGGTTIAGGTLQLGAPGAVPAHTVTANATFDLNTYNATIDALNGSGTVDTVAGGTPRLTVGANGGSGTFTGIIQNNAGTLGLIKVGTGTQTLSGGYTYSGPTVVAGGTLNLTTVSSLPSTPGDMIVSNAAVLTVDASGGMALPANGVVFGTNTTVNLALNSGANGINAAGGLTFQDNATNNLSYGNLSANPTGIAINAAGAISAPGTNIVISISGVGLKAGTITLIKYTGTALGSIANFVLALPPGVVGTLTNDTVNRSIGVNIGSAPKIVSWYGTGGPTWDLATVNWKDVGTGADTIFQQYTNGSVIAGDGVRFDDTLTNDFVNPQPTNISLTGTFYAFPLTVDSSLPYAFNGGGITGSTSLIKSNTGSLTLNCVNGYTAGTFIYGGSINITNDSALGVSAGPVTLGGGTLQINGGTTNSRVFSVPATSSIGVATNVIAQLNGAVTGAGGLTKTDNGTLTLAGSNGITGGLTVSQGTLNTSGTENLPAVVTVGNSSGANAVLNMTGGALNALNNSSQFTSGLVAGSAAGSAGDIRLTSGTLQVRQQLGLGAGAGGYGAMTISGGTVSNGSYVVVGFNNDQAVLNMSGGTLSLSNNLMTIAAGGSASVGVANLTGGTFNSTATTGNGSTIGGVFVGENGSGVLNVSGATVNLTGWGLRIGHNSGATGTANLNGGTVTTVSASRGSGTATLNFNGGTLKASAANTAFITGLTSANIYNNGAIIDDGGFAVTIPQTLQTPTGYGVGSIALSTGGSGYIDSPIVTISGGAGSNATATATVSGGAVTAITVTCPGTDYTSSDSVTVSFAGGGASVTPAAAGTVSFVQNGTGGLTKKGAGTLTLSGVNTFGGPVTNTAGTLALNSASTYTGDVRVNAGTLSMTTAPIIKGNTTVTNGATLSITQIGTATSTISNLTFLGGATGSGVTLGLGLTAGNNTAVPLLNCGTLTLNGTNSISLAGAVNVGTIALVKYASMAGTGNCTNLILPQGAAGTIQNDTAHSTLNAVITSTGPGLAWTGTNSNAALTNLWDINSTVNWLLNSTATTYRQTIVPGDPVTFNDAGSGVVILNTNVGPASILISNNSKSYNFTGRGSISGPTGLQKLGSGTAIMYLTNNTYTGDTIVGNGTLQAGFASVISPAANLVVGPAGTFELAGLSQTAAELTGSGIVNNNSGLTTVLTVGGTAGGTWNGTIKDVGAGGVSLTRGGSGTWFVGGSNYLNNGDAFTTRAQINSGTTIITNGGLISVPYMEFWIAPVAGSAATVIVDHGTLNVGNNYLVVGRGDKTANGTLIVNNGTVAKTGANSLVVGSTGATGTLIVNGGQVLNNSLLLLGEGSTGNGYLHLNGGLIQATQVRGNNNSGLPAISSAYFNGGTLQATAGTNDFISIPTTPYIQSGGLILDDGGFAISFAASSAPLQEDSSSPGGGVTKQGAGTVYYDAGALYSGLTRVSSGMLAGVGSVSGPVLVAPAGTLGAGDAGASVGAFTINNNLTLQGNAALRIDKTGGSTVNDQVVVTGDITYGGILTVSNITSDATALGTTNTFQLFNVSGAKSGNFAGIAGSPGAGMSYRFDATAGILSIVPGGVATNRTNITAKVSGSTLTLTWPGDHQGWTLQSQTNSTGLTANGWYDVVGSDAGTNAVITINPANPAVFYRLRHLQ